VVNESPDLEAVPARLRPLVEQCLVKDPADRPTPSEVLASLSDDVEILTGEWLPQPIAETMVRYSPTLQTPLPPALREPEPAPAEPAAAAAGVSGHLGPVGYEPTELGAVVPAAAEADPVAATRVEHGLLPQTAFIPASGAVTAAGRDVAGGTGGIPPVRPPSPFRRWRWPAAAAAAVVVAVVAVLLATHSNGATPKVGVTSTASLAGDATRPPTSTPSPTTTKRPTTPTSQSAVFTPSTQAATATSGTPTSSTSATPTPTSSTSATPTATTAPTTSAPTPSASPTVAPTSSPAGTSAAQSS
jgi:hypothetical protein